MWLLRTNLHLDPTNIEHVVSKVDVRAGGTSTAAAAARWCRAPRPRMRSPGADGRPPGSGARQTTRRARGRARRAGGGLDGGDGAGPVDDGRHARTAVLTLTRKPESQSRASVCTAACWRGGRRGRGADSRRRAYGETGDPASIRSPGAARQKRRRRFHQRVPAALAGSARRDRQRRPVDALRPVFSSHERDGTCAPRAATRCPPPPPRTRFLLHAGLIRRP